VIDLQVSDGVVLPAGLDQVVVSAAESAMTLAGRAPDSVDVSVVITDDAEIARLNQQFRGVSGPTDVLSFEPDPSFPGAPDELRRYLGDVLVSLPRAQEQAESAGHSVAYELAYLVAHGTLHLLGYDHADEEERLKMWALQEQAAREAVGGHERA
jgi:probable rRNA maturation factor